MDKNSFAPVPPMGWNSWDCYGAAVTEKELLQNIDYMAEHLKKHGWEYIVCDIQWYEPTADSSHYHKFADLCMDEYGRLVPAPNRFPSAAGGKGFRAIADYAHGKGLKFGIHIMRGIPRQAVAANTPVKGTPYTARDIAHPNSICCWNTDMYGVDTAMPGAQEYYDSLIELYASWGVDYIKVDDICVKYARPNDENTLSYGGDEIELLHRAIMKSRRAIVLSLSPGPAMPEQAEHLSRYANMWRITNDLWDRWEDIEAMFGRCDTWSRYVAPGCYPDCDMLPLGHLSIRGCEHGLAERQTRLSREEQRTMMTLWCIFGSPLMLGCELTDMDEWTRALITNDEVLRLQQHGTHPCQVLRQGGFAVWKAGIGETLYVALFNTAGWAERYTVSFDQLGLSGAHQVRDVWTGEELGETKERLTAQIPAHGARLYGLSL